MKIFSDIIEFLKTLSFVDYVFFFAVVILFVLIITLIYFIKVNDEVFEEKKVSNNKENELMEITKKLESDSPRIRFTSYEKDQEDKAIISYDELIKKSKTGVINYEEEQEIDGLSIKKIDLDSLIKVEEEPKFTNNVRVISYRKEEEFLESLKKLQNLIN